MNAIEVKGLTKNFKEVRALNGVTLSVAEGELFGLLGENGAGKTTLIRILSGLVKADGGSARIFGRDIGENRMAVNKTIGVSPQETAVAPNLTVEENLKFFADIYGVSDGECLKQIVEDFKLESVLTRRVKTLSGGWQRRLSIAVALVTKPKLLFLDEPTLGLDVMARRELWEEIKRLKGKVTIVLTSHYLEEIEALCEKVCIMAKGNILARGTTEEIKRAAGEEKFEEAFVKIVLNGEVIS